MIAAASHLTLVGAFSLIVGGGLVGFFLGLASRGRRIDKWLFPPRN